MDEKTLRSRISQITTQWTLLSQAHGESDDVARQARSALLGRYCE